MDRSIRISTPGTRPAHRLIPLLLALACAGCGGGERNVILDRYRATVADMRAGNIQDAQERGYRLFNNLSIHGINRNKGLTATLVNEDLKVWKGEPFEQAMAFYYIGLIYGELGSWDNTRAAMLNSLYHLQDYGSAGPRIKPAELERRALAVERGQTPPPPAQQQGGYAAIKTDFSLGYLLCGVANQQIARPDEARDQFNEAVNLSPGLAPIVDRFLNYPYNVVVVVDYGRGPNKVGDGPDGVYARFVPRTPSEDTPLRLSLSDATIEAAPAVNLNRLAEDQKWNHLVGMREFKSQAGTAMILGGAATAASTDNRDAQLAGLGIALAGLYLKAGAHADLRYCDVLPQRVYVAPIQISRPGTLRLSVGARSVSRDVAPPEDGIASLLYIAMNAEYDEPPRR